MLIVPFLIHLCHFIICSYKAFLLSSLLESSSTYSFKLDWSSSYVPTIWLKFLQWLKQPHFSVYVCLCVWPLLIHSGEICNVATVRFKGIIFACMFSCFNYLHWGYSTIIANWSHLLMCANVYNSRILKIQILTLCLPPNTVCRSCYRWCLLNEHPHCKHTAHSTAVTGAHPCQSKLIQKMYNWSSVTAKELTTLDLTHLIFWTALALSGSRGIVNGWRQGMCLDELLGHCWALCDLGSIFCSRVSWKCSEGSLAPFLTKQILTKSSPLTV